MSPLSINFKKPFFSPCKFSIHLCLDLCFLYLNKLPIKQFKECIGQSTATITEWTYFIRQLVGESIEPNTMITRGPGIKEEINEIQMGKRKSHRGHLVEGVWVACGVTRTPEKKFFFIDVKNRNINPLNKIISK